MLDRHGLVTRYKRSRTRAQGTSLSIACAPNKLWCADYKGEFMLRNRCYCYPLTTTDSHGCFLLACEGLDTTKEQYAISAFEQMFKEYRLPETIRTDNGVPFASPNALYGLSRLSVWWLRLGIAIERIKPDNPQQNAQHERPHQVINMQYPGEIYKSSTRPYVGLKDIDYPFHDKAILVTQCGRICLNNRKINLTTVLAGQWVGIKEVSDKIWLVSFMQYDLGYFDETANRVEPIDNPFGERVLPMSPE